MADVFDFFNFGFSSLLPLHDFAGPRLGSIGLDAGSDTGYRGDGRTETAVVDITGRTRAWSTVEIGGVETTADRFGRFAIDDLMLELGTHDYDVTITDRAGRVTESTLTLTRLENSVINWNDITLDAIRSSSTAPMYATRLLAMESTAVYGVIEAFDNAGFGPGRGGFATFGASREAAIAQAAYEVLTGIYDADSGPYRGSEALRDTLDDARAAALAEVPDGWGERRGVAIGHRIAQEILAERAGDGWDTVVDPTVEIGTGPGEWRPTPTGLAPPLAPHWGNVATWSIEATDQFLPPPPPAIGSAQYAEEYNETRLLGASNSEALGQRTADQTQLALFWADGGGTDTPPGHWNRIAGEAAQTEGLSTSQIAALYAKLNMALADAAITCWDAKYTYDYWRPVTAIREGDNDGNALTTGDAAWQPLIATPPFPEYTSGHSTFSGAAATILTAEFGDGYAFATGTSSSNPALAGVTRSFDSFWDAANEAGRSRIYGGIHFQSANREGLACGEQIANSVLDSFGN